MELDPTLDLEPAVEAAARTHYAHTWANVNGDPEKALAAWDAGWVGPSTMDYHRAHVRPLVEACAPLIAHQTWEKADAWMTHLEGMGLDLNPWTETPDA